MQGIGAPAGGGRILDFDIENRPLTYWQKDCPTAEVTSIASCWTDDLSSVEVVLLAPPCYHCAGRCTNLPDGVMSEPEMLERFVARYNEADMVTGHFIRGHDLPIINGALMENDMPSLLPKMTSDTRLDMVRKGDIPATQEFLLELLDIPVKKRHMTQKDWREANRLTPKGVELTKERVASDVLGHILMRSEMLKRGLVRSKPRPWRA